jgi:hypothetical protein
MRTLVGALIGPIALACEKKNRKKLEKSGGKKGQK